MSVLYCKSSSYDILAISARQLRKCPMWLYLAYSSSRPAYAVQTHTLHPAILEGATVSPRLLASEPLRRSPSEGNKPSRTDALLAH
jgi:hypothetical protein